MSALNVAALSFGRPATAALFLVIESEVSGIRLLLAVRPAVLDVGSVVVPYKVARWQNLIPSFLWIAPGWRAWGAIQGKEGVKFCSVA